MVHEEVMAAVTGVCRVVAVAQEAARVEIATATMEVAAAEAAAAVPIVPVVVATAAVAGLMAAVGDANGGVHVKLYDVTYAPLLSYNLFSLPSLALKGHTYAGKKYGMTLQLKKGKTVIFSRIRRLCHQYGYRQRRRIG